MASLLNRPSRLYLQKVNPAAAHHFINNILIIINFHNMKTSIGITEEHRKEVSTQLNKLLADEFILYTKTKKAHWNVEGSDFHSKHLFFETQFGQLDDIIDNVAERIRSLGHYAVGSLGEFLAITHLLEVNQLPNDSVGFIRELLEDHDSIIDFLRANIDIFV